MGYRMIVMWFVAASAWAGSGDGLPDWLRDGELQYDFRYRMESVDQDGFDEDALANTLRARVGFASGKFHGWSFLVDFEHIAVLGGETYNDTANGRFDRPVVADREDTELNRAHLNYDFGKKQRLILGRQRIIFDNARFIGNVGWRQNEQTFDAALWRNKAWDGFTLTLGYMNNVNRIFGDHHPNPARAETRMNNALIHGQFAKKPWLTLSVFGYLFENKDAPAASHRNIGFYGRGQWPEGGRAAIYEASFVQQDRYRDGADFIDADYSSVAAGVKWNGLTAKLGLETLGGDGAYGFATPLATAHGYNGWADLFLATPADGLEDLYASVAYARDAWRATAVFHRFDADNGGRSYGEEWDALLAWRPGKWGCGVKFADYQAERFGVDTRKLWLFVELRR